MTIILPFPSATHPTPQAVLAAIYALASRHRAWSLEMEVSEDGRPSVSVVHRTAGGFMSAHWMPGGWAVVAEDMATVVCRSPDLSAALTASLA